MKKWIFYLSIVLVVFVLLVYRSKFYSEDSSLIQVKEEFFSGDSAAGRKNLKKVSGISSEETSLYCVYFDLLDGKFEDAFSILRTLPSSEEVVILRFLSTLLLNQDPVFSLPDCKEAVQCEILKRYQKREFEEIDSLFMQVGLKESKFSDWFSHIFNKYYPKEKWMHIQAHSLITLNKSIQARELLEQSRESFKNEDFMTLFLLGLSYHFEALDKNAEAAVPYCTLAQSYFERVPLYSSNFKNEKEIIIQSWKKWAIACIEEANFQDLTEYTALLAAWKEEEILIQLSINLFNKVLHDISHLQAEDIQTYALSLSNDIKSSSLRDYFGEQVQAKVTSLMKEDAIPELALLWRLAKWFSPFPVQTSEEIGNILANDLKEKIHIGTFSNEELEFYANFWDFLNLTSESSRSLPFDLLEETKSLWFSNNSSKQAFAYQLLQQLSSFVFYQDQASFHSKRKDFLEILLEGFEGKVPKELKDACATYYVALNEENEPSIEVLNLEAEQLSLLESSQRALQKGRLLEAEKGYLRLVREETDFETKTAYMPVLSRIYKIWGRWDDALLWARNYHRIYLDRQDALHEVISIYIGMSRWDLVLEQLKSIEDTRELQAKEWLWKAYAMWALGSKESAEENFKLVVEQNLELLDEESLLLANHLSYVLGQEWFYASFQDPVKALRSYLQTEQIIKAKLLVEQKEGILEQSVEGLIELASLAIRSGDVKRALEKAYEAHRKAPYSYSIQAFLDSFDEDVNRVRMVLGRLESLPPSLKTSSWWTLLWVKNKLKLTVLTKEDFSDELYKAELISLKKALVPLIDKNQDSLDPYLVQSRIFYLLGEDQAAIEGLQYILKCVPSEKAPYLLLSLLYQEKGHFLYAEKFLQTALDYYPKDSELILAIANTLIVNKDWEKVQDFLLDTLKEESRHYLIPLTLASVYLEKNKKIEAEALLEKALLDYPGNVALLQSLADSMEGDPSKKDKLYELQKGLKQNMKETADLSLSENTPSSV